MKLENLAENTMYSKSIYLDEIDSNNLFYQEIMILAYSQFGINELLARGFYNYKRAEFPNEKDFVQEIQSLNFPNDVKEEILKTITFTPIIYVPGFLTKDRSKSYLMDPDDSARKLFSNNEYPFFANIQLTYLTIISAWEKVMAYNLEFTPVLHFFRHIRNAAAHNGRFQFDKKVIDVKSGELKEKAQWSYFEIKSNMQGIKLLPNLKDENNSFLDQGDLVEFLLDFENHYPELKHLKEKN